MSLFIKRASGALYPPRIACFVCGAEVPSDYPLYPEPPNTADVLLHAVTPHFPFLLHHLPPLGCRPPSPGGMAKSCRVCYSTLMRQWEEFERGVVPLDRRVYWFERVDGMPVVSPDLQLRAAAALQSKIIQARQHSRTLALLQSRPDVGATFDSRNHRHKVVNSPVPIIRPDLSTQPHIYWPKVSSHRPSGAPLLSLPPPQSAPSSAPSSIIQLSSGDHNESLLNVSTSSVSLNPPDNETALDLSSGARERETVKSRSSVTSHLSTGGASHHSYQSESAASASTSTSTAVTDILDLTLPDKNASFEVCYVCGDEFKRGTLTYAFARPVLQGEPFFTSLVIHPRPARSRPMDSGGRVQVCDDCYDHLIDQFTRFEEEEVPHADRNYVLRKRAPPSSDNTTFVCYICSLDYHSSSLRLLYTRPNNENEPYYPSVEQHKPPQGASPISPQGMVQVCNVCYKATKEKHHGFMSNEQPPLKKRRGTSHTFSLPRDPSDPFVSNLDGGQYDDEEKTVPADLTCPLCRRKFSIGFFLFLHTRPPPKGGYPYFPFLNDLPRPELCDVEEDTSDRVRVCKACNTGLINQWTNFQREQVPVEERVYAIQSLVMPRRTRPPSPTSGRTQRSIISVKSDEHSPRLRTEGSHHPSSDYPRARQTHLADPGIPPACHSPSFSTHSAASNDHIQSHASLSQPGASTPKPVANASSFYCFLCGLHSELTFSRMLYSSAPGKKAPYFPFMKKHVPKNRAEALREDGTALVCTFCYHSVMMQWSRYNDITRSQPVDPTLRTYNLNDYRCYVCLSITNRKRIRALRVIDFPFLRDLKFRKNAIQMENGEMVAVCLDCYENLRNQYLDYSKRGFPPDKREYKWMQVPLPPDEMAALGVPQPLTSEASTSVTCS